MKVQQAGRPTVRAAGHRLGVRRMNKWTYLVQLPALLMEFV